MTMYLIAYHVNKYKYIATQNVVYSSFIHTQTCCGISDIVSYDLDCVNDMINNNLDEFSEDMELSQHQLYVLDSCLCPLSITVSFVVSESSKN